MTEKSTRSWIAPALGGLALLLVGCGVGGWFLAQSLLRGPDFSSAGGTELLLELDLSSVEAGRSAAVTEEVVEALRARAALASRRRVEVARGDGEGEVLVRIPRSDEEGDGLEHLLSRSYGLEFRKVRREPRLGSVLLKKWEESGSGLLELSTEELVQELGTPLPEGVVILQTRSESQLASQEPHGEPLLVEEQVLFSGDQVDSAAIEWDQFGMTYVRIDLDEAGKAALCQASTDGVGEQLAIVVDGRLLSAPVVQEPICGGAASVSWGLGDPDAALETENLSVALQAGSLPVPISEKARRSVPPSGQ